MTKTNPYGDLLSAIDRALEYKVPIKVQPMSKDGDICFTVPLDTLPWTQKSLSGPIVHTRTFASLIGEILVRTNLIIFNDVILSNHYPKACQDFRHLGFGLTVTKTEIRFDMHCSFLMRIFNDFLNKEVEEASKEIKIKSEKRPQKDDLPSITSYGDGKSFKVQVAKHGDLRHSISLAISTILSHYGIKKNVHTTMGMFSMEIDTCDEEKAESY